MEKKVCLTGCKVVPLDKQVSFKVDNQEVTNLIESLHYETEARKDIITFYISNGMDTTSQAFKNYNTEYREFYVQYTTAKEVFEKDYIVPKLEGKKYTRWNLDFASRVVTVELA